MTEAEITGIKESFRDPTYAREHVLVVNETKYRCVRADETAIYAKEVGESSLDAVANGAQGKSGVIISQTQQHFIIATYKPGMHASICAEATETLCMMATYVNLHFQQEDHMHGPSLPPNTRIACSCSLLTLAC